MNDLLLSKPSLSCGYVGQVISVNGVHVAQYTVTGQERQHVFVQRGAGADPSRPPPVEPEPEPEPDNGAFAFQGLSHSREFILTTMCRRGRR